MLLTLSRPLAASRAQQFAWSQEADTVRLPWEWRPRGRTTEPYAPQLRGKWWSFGEEELAAATPNKQRDYGHIGRIMETELGEQLHGKDRCTACQSHNEECWVYSEKGSQQVSRPGDACTRCRLVARTGGCSLSKRRKRQPPPSPPTRFYRPLGPKDGPPPGCGVSGVMV